MLWTDYYYYFVVVITIYCTFLRLEGGWVEPRICDYTGFYYCPTCHWNDTVPIPARILHNWDFTSYRVCRGKLSYLKSKLS